MPVDEVADAYAHEDRLGTLSAEGQGFDSHRWLCAGRPLNREDLFRGFSFVRTILRAC